MPDLTTTDLRSPFKTFRGVGPSFIENTDSIRKIERTFDEPTYLTFRLEFNTEQTDNDLVNTNFDKFPQPLFSRYSEDDINARNYYSTFQYLRDSNEIIRSQMLQEFISKWGQLQNDFQWYFQSVSGLNSLMSISPARGRRVAQDAKVTITTLEGIDQRITHLLNLYRKIAFDDVYQRWILPDMMRFFRLRIYVTEFRTFHRSNFMPQSEINPETGQRFVPGLEEGTPMILTMINNMVPTYILELERCEFDLESFNMLPDSINIGQNEMRQLEFSIKVGNFRERYINPIFNYYWYDMLVNGFGRTAQTGETLMLSGSTQAGQAAAEGVKAQSNLLATQSHQSGKPFIQTGNIDNIHNSSPNYSIDTASVNPIDPATWVGNALTAGKALVTNLVESKIDELKLKKIPGLGISFNEALAAIQSKNVFTLFGAARRALTESVAGTLPSQELEDNFVDTKFKEFLQGIVQSEATDGDAVELKSAANMILNDRGQWEKIKDLSKATNLVSEALNEINSLAQIENRNALKASYSQQTYIGTPVQDGLVYEGLPSSVSTSKARKDLEGQKIQQPEVGEATSIENIQVESMQFTSLGSTDGTLEKGSQIAPSSQLGVDAGESLTTGQTGLGSEAEGGYNIPAASSQLGTKAEGGYDIPAASSQLGTDAGQSKDLPEPGEAVDDDPVEGSPLPRPNLSQATNNKLDQ